jgi:hypothetical protein
MLTLKRRGVVVPLLVALLVLPGVAWAAPPETSTDLKRQEVRVTKIEQRLAAIQTPDRQTELVAAGAKAMLDLSHRYLDRKDIAAARLHADIAERFVALAEEKAVQQ